MKPTLSTIAILAISWTASLIAFKPSHHPTLPPTEDIARAIELSARPQTQQTRHSDETLKIQIDINNSLPSDASFKYSVLTVDSNGEEVAPPYRSTTQTLPRGTSTIQHSSPKGLPDGAYTFRFLVAAIDDNKEFATAEHSVHAVVMDGRIAPSSPGDHYQESVAQETDKEDYAGNATDQQSMSSAHIDVTPLACPPNAECCPIALCEEDPPLLGSSGYVQGTLRFFNHQGAYCPNLGTHGVAARDCTGAKYLESQYDTAWPVREVKVRLHRTDTGAVVGTGSSDANGSFKIFWMVPETIASISLRIEFEMRHRNNRFRVATHDGAYVHFRRTAPIIAQNGTTYVGGSWTWGSAADPDPFLNIYDGAWRTWTVLSQSNRMLAYFNDVEIRALGVGDGCMGSCSVQNSKRIYIADTRQWAPTIAHEIGHVASTLASRDQELHVATDYMRDGNDGHRYDSPEHGAPSFEEGVANFFAVVRDYHPNAPNPTLCNRDGACRIDLFNVETSTAANGQPCETDEDRWEISVTRYLWDSHDTVVDGTDTISSNIYEIIDTLHSFNNGTNNRNKHEPFDSNWNMVDLDGRSAMDFRENWISWGTDSTSVFNMNCAPVGD